MLVLMKVRSGSDQIQLIYSDSTLLLTSRVQYTIILLNLENYLEFVLKLKLYKYNKVIILFLPMSPAKQRALNKLKSNLLGRTLFYTSFLTSFIFKVLGHAQ